MLDSLAGAQPNKYRHLLLARSRVAILPPGPAPLRPGQRPLPPLFDAGLLGASPGVLAAIDRFTPTLLVHLQDWGTGRLAGNALGLDEVDVGETATPLAGAGLRSIESFHLETSLHEALDAGARRRTWLGRPTTVARELAAHPDARSGQLAVRHAGRMGYRLFDHAHERAAAADPTTAVALRLVAGRYAPQLPWRLLGAACLGEIALARYGALGLTGQTFENPPEERIGAGLAYAEGAILYHLTLERPEGAS